MDEMKGEKMGCTLWCSGLSIPFTANEGDMGLIPARVSRCPCLHIVKLSTYQFALSTIL